jgi:hypothetical protein
VADGAVIWRIKANVTSRAPRFSFGIVMSQQYDPSNKDHAGRTTHREYDGLDYVSGIWSMIVQRVGNNHIALENAGSVTDPEYCRELSFMQALPCGSHMCECMIHPCPTCLHSVKKFMHSPPGTE